MLYGDEITPESLHESLYGANNEFTDDVHIRLNSYGGSCNAAVRMFDDIRAYPGSVSITISGTAASAATMLCMAADQLEITPGSLFMIHDPSMMAFGNEQDLSDSINQLRACKESILNMYERRTRVSRNDTSSMMTATTWMDAKVACEYGFVDSIVDDPVKYPVNSAENHTASVDYAKQKVNDWLERKKKPIQPKAEIVSESAPPEPQNTPDPSRIKVALTDHRLENLKY